MTRGNLRQLERESSGVRIDLLATSALCDADAEQVLECLLGRKPRAHILDGDRSIVFPTRSATLYGGIKIKGAGYRGGPVRLGQRHDKPYPLPRYDAEGSATLDAAKDHGRAPAGGMSYQQARHEFTVSRHLEERGVQVFPALAYGALRRDASTSWFCVLDWPCGAVRDWWQLTRDRDAVARIAQVFGDSQLELARHDVYLALSGLVAHRDALLRKDFHTVHIAGPNDSFLTRLSCFLFDVNFLLAQFSHDRHLPDIADHRVLARTTYLRALTSKDHGPDDIARFKGLLVELKYADWEMQPRMERLTADPIGRILLERFLAESGEQSLFGALPDGVVYTGTPTSAAHALGAAPAPEPRRRFPWLRRTR
jgi:hypothetical protein